MSRISSWSETDLTEFEAAPFLKELVGQKVFFQEKDKKKIDLSKFKPKSKFTCLTDSRQVYQGSKLSVEENIVWLDIFNPTKVEVLWLSDRLNLHYLTLKDILLGYSNDSVEVYDHYISFCMMGFNNDQKSVEYLSSVPIFVLIFKRVTVSIHFKRYGLLRPTLVKMNELETLTPISVAYGIVDTMLNELEPTIFSLKFDVDSIDDLVLVLDITEHNDLIRRIRVARKMIMGLKRILLGKISILKRLADMEMNKHFEHALNHSTIIIKRRDICRT